MTKSDNEYQIIEVFDEDSGKTIDDVIRSLKWWYEDILFNYDYTSNNKANSKKELD
ncbi:hypothetical protein ACQCN2_16180 [Brevibacillus ginsengisoli]|uniref:hypothetical protein n=1 Tax=Brevibacillus ginsengisoli TaxID=363854 RepID=UPI003CE76AD6